MIQQIRSNKLLPASTITKLLRNTAPDLSAAVPGGYIITPDGDILFNPDGNYEETPDHA